MNKVIIIQDIRQNNLKLTEHQELISLALLPLCYRGLDINNKDINDMRSWKDVIMMLPTKGTIINKEDISVKETIKKKDLVQFILQDTLKCKISPQNDIQIRKIIQDTTDEENGKLLFVLSFTSEKQSTLGIELMLKECEIKHKNGIGSKLNISTTTHTTFVTDFADNGYSLLKEYNNYQDLRELPYYFIVDETD